MMNSRYQRRVRFVLVACLLVAASLVATLPGSAAPLGVNQRASANPKPDVVTALVASPLASPHPVVGADDRRHLVYELELINPTQITITVDRVETVDPATDQVLSVLEGDGVAAVMVPFGAKPGATLKPGAAGFILMDASLPKDARVPARLVHDFTLSFEPNPGLPSKERSGSTEVIRDTPVVIGRPLKGARWVAVNGCCAGLNSHRSAVNPINGAFYVSERFAIDFVQLDAEGRLFVGPPDKLSSYPYYGADVVSVAGGVVVRTQDGLPDNSPVGSLPANITAETAGGNYVVVDIGAGHFAFYAHLQPGSLKVHVGDHVRRGQILGALGNSGNSDAPHLHFHVVDTPSPLASDGLPYEFRAFGSEGTIANGDEVLAGGTATIDPALSGHHSRQLPLDLEVISFPSRKARR
jgi:hypothetical protein